MRCGQGRDRSPVCTRCFPNGKRDHGPLEAARRRPTMAKSGLDVTI